MRTAKRILALTLMIVVFGAVYASAQQAPAPAPAQQAPTPAPAPAATPAVKDIQSLAGKWTGWGTPASGSAFPMEVRINPDGSYTSMMGATSGKGQLKVVDGKISAEGHLSGPAGVAAGTGKSQATLATKRGKQVLSGAGRSDAGPFNYELTKE
jgi:hypothetical protein